MRASVGGGDPNSGPERSKFVAYKQKGEKYLWRLVAPNGKETAASGQHFASHYDAKRAAEEVKTHAAAAEIVEA
jgi:uncharacterized protein YegP (UPF0339 family)